MKFKISANVFHKHGTHSTYDSIPVVVFKGLSET
jgi:hypothetical protein